ncbi:MAG: RNA polymerase sigma factor [Chloroflexi bacterium]|nr:RNA polymerase sigma factor [Chloroflexota bacterium]
MLVREYQVRAVRAAYLITQDLPTAQDVVQNAFLKAYERAGQFDSKRPFGPWFLRIVVNDAAKAAARQHRSVSLNHRVAGIEVALSEVLADSSPGPEHLAELAEVRDALWKALGELSPKERAAVVLRYYLGLKEAEISERIGRPLGTVKWLLHAAKKRLRALLAARLS